MIIATKKFEEGSLVARERAAGELVFLEEDDNAVIGRMNAEVEGYDPSLYGGRRLECWLLLDDATSLWLLQTVGVPDEVRKKADVLATTAADLMAKTLLVRLPGRVSPFPPLDRRPIGRDSEVTVHLVLLGAGNLAEAVALNAALVAHYPNYCRDTRLRTRITLVSEDVSQMRDRLLQRYAHLFAHSYHRMLDLSDTHPVCHLHRPQYEGQRKDFVDVEWEFVKGDSRNGAVRQKLSEWAVSERQLLTVALCHADDGANLTEAVSLPQAVYDAQTPVFCHAEKADLLRLVQEGKAYGNVIAFNQEMADLGLLRVLKLMGQCVNYVYHHCFALEKGAPITAPAHIDVVRLDALWAEVPSLPKQYSNVFNAMTLGTKMHSLGHREEEMEKSEMDEGAGQAYYALSMDEVDVMTEVEHNRWSLEELMLGYRPMTDDEMRMVEEDVLQKKRLRDEKKVHYDLRAFDDLREDETGKNVNVYDMALTQAIPLIVKTCITD